MDIILGIKQMNLDKFPYEELKSSFDSLTFTDTWQNVAEVWQNVDGLTSFFTAIGKSFVGLFDSVTQIGIIIYNTTIFVIKAFGWLFNNLMTIIKFLFDYIITI